MGSVRVRAGHSGLAAMRSASFRVDEVCLLRPGWARGLACFYLLRAVGQQAQRVTLLHLCACASSGLCLNPSVSEALGASSILCYAQISVGVSASKELEVPGTSSFLSLSSEKEAESSSHRNLGYVASLRYWENLGCWENGHS